MANIHVERRKQAGNVYLIWMVVVVLLIAAALVYFFVVRNRTQQTTAPPADTAGAVYQPAKQTQAV